MAGPCRWQVPPAQVRRREPLVLEHQPQAPLRERPRLSWPRPSRQVALPGEWFRPEPLPALPQVRRQGRTVVWQRVSLRGWHPRTLPRRDPHLPAGQPIRPPVRSLPERSDRQAAGCT